jgi:hypothetical protein
MTRLVAWALFALFVAAGAGCVCGVFAARKPEVQGAFGAAALWFFVGAACVWLDRLVPDSETDCS